ncbi:MAG: hypothetical protein IJ008_04160 [Clostridia bacterium]|nr:hypothetical protein [Clostridia bacterium]
MTLYVVILNESEKSQKRIYESIVVLTTRRFGGNIKEKLKGEKYERFNIRRFRKDGKYDNRRAIRIFRFYKFFR